MSLVSRARPVNLTVCIPITLGTCKWHSPFLLTCELWEQTPVTGIYCGRWDLPQWEMSLWFLLRVIVSGISVGPWSCPTRNEQINRTPDVKSTRGSMKDSVQVKSLHDTIKRVFRSTRTKVKLWDCRAGFWGQQIFLSPNYSFFPTGSQKSKLFARGVNENKCFMVWWWSGMGLLWPLTLLLKKQPTSSQLPWTNLHLPLCLTAKGRRLIERTQIL